MRVLVVDDNRVLADAIQSILEDEGMEVISANDGKAGYDAYLWFRPDVVITDIQMPGENGMEMMAQIRIHDPMIKTVYMSGNINAFRRLLEGEREHYPVSFFEKPFSLKSLETMISGPVNSRSVESAFAP